MNNKSVMNLGIRGLSLSARFLLSVFMLKYFTLGDIGLFGMLVAVTSVSPAILGFGVNYFFNRKIAVAEPAIAAQRVKERLLVSLGTGAVACLLAMPLGLKFSQQEPLTLALLGVVFILEMCLMDLHFSLLSMRKAILANILLFSRSALWVYPFMGLAWFVSDYRNFNSILWFWLAGQLASIPFALNGLKGDAVRGIGAAINGAFSGRVGWVLIYVSDIGIAAMGFSDRFILGSVLDLKAFGAYVFFATMANSVYLLLTASVTQICLPDMLAEGARSGFGDVMSLIMRNYRKAVFYWVPMGALVFALTLVVVDLFEKNEMKNNGGLLAILLVTALIRILADLANQGLYATGADKPWAYINLFGALLAICFGLPMAHLYGAIGMATGAMVAMVVVFFIRHRLVSANLYKLSLVQS
jgi:O-antigen/teichoic acid export membrane protein